MNSIIKVALLFVGFIFAFNGVACAQVVIDFDELLPPDQGNGDFFFDGYGADAVAGSWSSNGALFNTQTFGPGWSYSRVNDAKTAGFTNQWAAVTGTDVSGTGNYALATTFSPNGAYINLPEGFVPDSVAITNSTYAFLAMLLGDSFAKMFGGEDGTDPDWFRVTLTGFDALDAQGQISGQLEFFLADFRFEDSSKDFIVEAWTDVDLLPLGRARSIGIAFDGSDVGMFGLNTPAYVAIDNLVVVLLGDVNMDGEVNLLDVDPFVAILVNAGDLAQADINRDGMVDLLDVSPFVDLLTK